MSNAEIIALIDAVLALPVYDSTKNDLRSFRSQIQNGTITDQDRNYIMKLCQRLQQNKHESHKPSVPSKVDDDRQGIVASPFEPSPLKGTVVGVIEFVANACIASLILFFWFYSGYDLLKEHRVLDAKAALVVFPIGIIFGLGRFIGWW